MPSYVELNGNVRLTRSKKGDCYYTTSLTDCSCKARTFNPGAPCKHMIALQASREEQPAAATITKQSIEETLREADKNLHKQPYGYQRMVRAAREAAESDDSDSIMPRKPFRPFIEDDGKPIAEA